MPVSLQIDPAVGATVITITQQMTCKDVRNGIAEFYRQTPHANCLCDFSNVSEMEISADEVKQVADILKKLRNGRRGGKTALVSPADNVFGMSRMLEIMLELHSDSPTVCTKVFRTLPAAMRWLQDQEGRA